MSEPLKDGVARRKHLEAAAKLSRAAREELKGPPIPEELLYLWSWFTDVAAARRWNKVGDLVFPEPISYSEIYAWSSLTRTPLRQWEVEALRFLDGSWLGGKGGDDGS